MLIGGLQKTSFLDYPDKISAIIFTLGCNFRCGYCHNPELINAMTAKYSEEEIFEFLNRRKGRIDGVVITGGEPCIQKDLVEFIKKVKDLGFLVKLDTNGCFPEILQKSMAYVDYIAMDIKAPLDNYSKIVNVNVDEENIKKSINLIMNSGIEYEFRTTVVRSMLSKNDFDKIGDLISGAKRYYLQKFVSSKILDEKLSKDSSYTDEEFSEIVFNLKKKIEFVEVR